MQPRLPFILLALALGACEARLLSCYADLQTGLSGLRIPAQLCTHLVAFGVGLGSESQGFAFRAGLSASQLRLLAKLKRINPDLKIIISLSSSSPDISAFIRHPSAMESFAGNLSKWLNSNNFDGFDIDWEFPRGPADKVAFVQWLNITRGHFRLSQRPLQISIAVGNALDTISHGYNVPALAPLIDFINLMTYDFHTWKWYTPFLGHNAPLFPEKYEFYPLSTLNVAWAASEWARLGMPKAKILVGLAAYGRAFRLMPKPLDLHFPYAPSPGVASPQFRTFTQACLAEKEPGITTEWDKDARVPYLWGQGIWFTYDNETSLKEKTSWTLTQGFGGLMYFITSSDDYEARCRSQPYPLLRTIHATLHSSRLPSTP